MMGNHAIRNLIRDQKSHLINNAILSNRASGMQLMDFHLKQLVSDGVVTQDEAVRYMLESPIQTQAAVQNQ
jgi:twitching motility protein PilT